MNLEIDSSHSTAPRSETNRGVSLGVVDKRESRGSHSTPKFWAHPTSLVWFSRKTPSFHVQRYCSLRVPPVRSSKKLSKQGERSLRRPNQIRVTAKLDINHEFRRSQAGWQETFIPWRNACSAVEQHTQERRRVKKKEKKKKKAS